MTVGIQIVKLLDSQSQRKQSLGVVTAQLLTGLPGSSISYMCHTARCRNTLNTVNCTVHTEQRKLHAAHSKLLTAPCKLYTLHCKLNTAHYTLHSADYTIHMEHYTLHTVNCTVQTKNASCCLGSAFLLLLCSRIMETLYTVR